jgi:hypothetical protein
MKKTIFFVLCLIAYTISAQKPELVLPAIHSTPVNSLFYSQDNRFMATCAGYEIKLWELKSGRLIRTILSPFLIADIALSEDGSKLVCAASCTENRFPTEYDSPEFNTEVQVWDMVAGEKLHTLIAFNEPVCINNVAISNDGNLVTAGYGDRTSLWDTRSDGAIWESEYLGAGTFSPDGTHLMSNVNGTLSWVDCKTGAKTEILQDSCAYYTFQGDAVVLLTTGSVLKRWDPSSKLLSADVVLPKGPELNDENIRFSQDGTQLGVLGIVFFQIGEEHKLGWLFRSFEANTGKLLAQSDTMEYDGGWADLAPDLQYFFTRPKGWELGVASGGVSAYSISTGQFSHFFGLKLLEATTDANLRCDEACREYKVYNGGRMILVDRGGGPSTLFLPESGELLCGVDADSVKFYAEHQILKEDKRWKLESLDNLSYNLIDKKTKRLVATLLLGDVFLGYDEIYDTGTSRIWAVTTPSGLFDASPEMMGNLHYVFGMEVIHLEQLKQRYYEPGLLGKLMGFSSDELRNVEDFDNVALYPEINAVIEKKLLSIELTERNGGIGKLSLIINGTERGPDDHNPERKKRLSIDLKSYAKFFYRGDTLNTIALRAYNQEGWLKSQAYELSYPVVGAKGKEGFKPIKSSGAPTPPSLYAVVVGTSNYAGVDLDLNFADQDAEAISQAFQASCSALFGADRTDVILLSTKGSSPEGISGKANIQKAFKYIDSLAKPEDVLLVYFSGHGLAYGPAEKEQFYYLTKDIGSEDLSDPAIRSNYTVSSEELTQWIKGISAAKKVMIIDACNAGKVVESLSEIGQKNLNPSQIRAFDRMKDRTGMFILTGSAADQVSYETSQYGQGLLTYSLLQGMSGLALTDDKRVDVMKLFQYSRDLVPELAKGIGRLQVPVIAFPLGEGSSFDIGIVGPEVKIPLAQAKPIFIRSAFQDENHGDELGLVNALEAYFLTTTLKGTMAKLIYANVSEYNNGYSIRGSYVIKGDAVEVKGSLFKGKTLQHKFQVAGKKDDVPGLVKLILGEVMPMAK